MVARYFHQLQLVFLCKSEKKRNGNWQKRLKNYKNFMNYVKKKTTKMKEKFKKQKGTETENAGLFSLLFPESPMLFPLFGCF